MRRAQQRRLARPQAVADRGRAGGCGLRRVHEAGQEQGLVDPALEDRDAQLHALRDDFLALEPGLARELRGRQVIGHRTPPCAVATSARYTARPGRAQPHRIGERSSRRLRQTGFGTSTKTCRTPKRSASSSPRRAHAEGLRRVVAGGEEVHAGLLRARHDALGRLAGEERVEARRRSRPRGSRRPRPRRSRSCARGRGRPGRPAARGPSRRGTRATSSAGVDAVAGEARRARRSRAPLCSANGSRRPRAQRAGQQRVVADLGMGVERQVVGGQAHVGVEEQPAGARLAARSSGARRAGPEQPVVHEHEVGALLARALEQLGAGGDAGHDGLDLVAARDLQAVRARSRRSRPGAAARPGVQ